MKNKYLITILAIALLNLAQASDGCVDIYKKAITRNSNGQGIAAVAPIMIGTIAGKSVEHDPELGINFIKKSLIGTTILSGVTALGLQVRKSRINKVLKPLEAAVAGDLDDRHFQKFSSNIIKLVKDGYDIDISDQDVYVELINMNNDQALCPLKSNGNKLNRALLSIKDVRDILIKRILLNY